ncbi:MAG: hypothetical protein IJ015_06495 [Ruminococcus sp.]|nr:hypothetical protein [Ruminococcus sp.]
MQIPLIVLVSLLAIIESIAMVFSIICNNLKEYGTPFVIYGTPDHGKPNTIITDIFAIIHPFVFVYFIIKDILI